MVKVSVSWLFQHQAKICIYVSTPQQKVAIQPIGKITNKTKKSIDAIKDVSKNIETSKNSLQFINNHSLHYFRNHSFYFFNNHSFHFNNNSLHFFNIHSLHFFKHQSLHPSEVIDVMSLYRYFNNYSLQTYKIKNQFYKGLWLHIVKFNFTRGNDYT